MGLHCVGQHHGWWLSHALSGGRGLLRKSLAAARSDAPEARPDKELTTGTQLQPDRSLTGALQRTISLMATQPLLAWQTVSRQMPLAAETVSLDAEAASSSFWLGLEAEQRLPDQEDGQVGAGASASGMDEASARLSAGKRLVQRYRDSVESNISGRRYRARRFVNKTGQRIFTHQWLPPDDGQPLRATVVLLHGLNEHSGRYDHFARRLNSRGYAVIGMDWIGHGMSEGLHGFVDRLDHVMDDARTLVERVLMDNPGVPCFMFGHSMGASIILKTVTEGGIGDRLAGLVLTAPAVRLNPPPVPILKVVAPILSVLHPTLQLARLGRVRLTKVSRDPRACEEKYGDPLVYTGALRARMGHEILCLVNDLERYIPEVRTPFIVLHGTGDQVTDFQGSSELHTLAASEAKDLRLYEGLFHDLLIEPEKEQIVEDIFSWLDSRLADMN